MLTNFLIILPLFTRTGMAALLMCMALTAWPLQAAAMQGGGAGDILDCENLGSDSLKALACKFVAQRINEELAKNNLSVSRDGLLYSLNDPTHVKIDTGHSCSVTAKVINKSASARLGSDIRLALSYPDAIDALADPVVFNFEVSVSVGANVRVEQKFGQKLLGKCVRLGSDGYNLKGSTGTRAKITVVVDMGISYGHTSDGDFEISIDPKVIVALSLDSFSIKFKASGVSPITPALTHVLGFSSTLTKAASSIFTGDGVSDLGKSLAFDIGAPIALSLLSAPANAIVNKFIKSYAKDKAKQAAEGYSLDLEESLTSKLRKALGVSGSGKRSFLIVKNYKELLAKDTKANILKSQLYCAWTYKTSTRCDFVSGISGPVAHGRRCTKGEAGKSFSQGNTRYTCQTSSALVPPPSYEPCS